MGDSHAVHWRAALEVVARAKGWRGVSMDQSQCLFSHTTTALQGADREACTRWNAQVQRWLEVHPKVSTLFMSQHRGGGVVVRPGSTSLETKIDGYISAWKALPPSVERVIVIRDRPYSTTRTPAASSARGRGAGARRAWRARCRGGWRSRPTPRCSRRSGSRRRGSASST